MFISLALALSTGQDPKEGRKLVFDQEFNRPGPLDDRVWYFDDGPVYNQEMEHYTSSNAEVKGGNLLITARSNQGKITSARIESHDSWRYGYFEIRAKVPGGRGTWPAIWLLNDSLRHPNTPSGKPWPDCGEIDIMEEVGYDPGTFHFSLHSAKFNWMKREQRTKTATVPDGATKFHVFGLDWRPNQIRFLMDGVETYKVDDDSNDYASWPFVDKFYMILNLAIGGSWGGAKGVDPSIFPSRYYIDYVKIYQ